MKIQTKSLLPYLATAGFILLFSGCMLYDHASVKPAAKINFSNYHSYAWVNDQPDSCDKIPGTMPIHDIAEGSIEQELQARGYAFEPDYPDLLLRVAVCNRKMEEVPNYFYPWSFSFLSPVYPSAPNLRSYSPMFSPSLMQIQADFLKSTITLFVYDRGAAKLVWCASTEQEVYFLSEIIPITRKSISTLMEKYPGKPLPGKTTNL